MATYSAKAGTASRAGGYVTDIGNVTDKLLICSVCKEKLKEPKFLPCLHTFCAQCLLDKTADKGEGERFLCLEKECKADAILPPGGAMEFPDNLFLANIIQSRHPSEMDHLCDFCKHQEKEEPAVARCLQCREFLCADCADMHNQTSLTISHDVRALNNLSSATIQGNILHNGTSHNRGDACIIHPDQTVQFYCYQCKSPVCENCLEEDHSGHKKIKLQSLVQQYRGQALTLVGKLQNKLVDIQQLSMSYDARLAARNIDQVKAQIQNTKLSMFKTLEDEERRLIAEIDKAFKLNERQGKGTSFQKAMQGREYDLRSSTEITGAVLDHGSNTELVYMQPSIKARLEALDRVPIPIIPQQQSFHFNPAPKPLLGTLQVETLKPKQGGKTQKQYEGMGKKMVPGTKVKRGRDWRYGNEDGDPPGQGKVVDQLFGLNGQDTEVSHIKVKWDKSGRTEKYRMGADGCYDLQLA